MTTTTKLGLYLKHSFLKWFWSNPKEYLSQSHKITLYPNWINGATLVDHETAGNITVLFFKKFPSNKAWAISKLAEDPELTNTEYFVEIFLENFFSKLSVTFD